MKKTFIILVLALSFLEVSAKEFSNDWFKTISINAKGTNSNWEGWRECKCDVCFDYDNCKIIIYSKMVQIFSFDNFVKTNYTNYYSFSGYVKDINNVKTNVVVYFYNNGSIYLHFIYPQGEYMYLLKKTKIK